MLDIKNLKITLDEELSKDRKVFIIPHLGADFDAIGSAIGLSILATKYKRESFILANDPIHKIDAGVKMIIDQSKSKYQINYINMEKYLKLSSENDLIILTDVNKYTDSRGSKLIGLEKEDIGEKKVIIIDHHNEDDKTIETDSKYIDQEVSSASELVAKLLFEQKVKIDDDIANYLLAGIYLDTAKFSKNLSSNTMMISGRLFEKGAEINKVNEFFAEDLASGQRVLQLVSNNLEVFNYSIGYVVGNNDDEYTREEIAKAADYYQQYRFDASFAIGKTDENIVSISARSKGNINVGEIMKQLGGGGNYHSAAARIENITIEDAKKQLQKVIKPSFYKK